MLKYSLSILSTTILHPVLSMDISERGFKILEKAYEIQPENYEELISLKGMGPKKLRALALISNLLFGAKISWEDPAIYSYSHGGKDGFPYLVDKNTYENSVSFLRQAIETSELDKKEIMEALKRLKDFTN